MIPDQEGMSWFTWTVTWCVLWFFIGCLLGGLYVLYNRRR